LEVKPGLVMVHLNTFHDRPGIEGILAKAREIGVRRLLIVTGDGSERLGKLSPESLGIAANTVTSVELLEFVRRAHDGFFTCGVAFNPYEPPDHEMEKMRRKVGAGAAFVVTQPVIGFDPRLLALKPLGLPVIVGAWMSKKLDLLSRCVGYEIRPDAAYDPMANLTALREAYPDWCLYLSLVGLKTQLPVLREMWSAAEQTTDGRE
jgi:methylenetetrahydrofolate reductase (NADPH)